MGRINMMKNKCTLTFKRSPNSNAPNHTCTFLREDTEIPHPTFPRKFPRISQRLDIPTTFPPLQRSSRRTLLSPQILTVPFLRQVLFPQFSLVDQINYFLCEKKK